MRISDKRFISVLRCPDCRSSNLFQDAGKLHCRQCNSTHQIIDSTFYLLDKELKTQYQKYQTEAQKPINRFKNFIKQSPWLFQFLTYAIGSISYFGCSPQKALKKLFTGKKLEDKIIINVGSGIKRIHPEIINLDIFPFKNVDLVADATKLPIKDDTVDMIVTESTLEHIPDSAKVMEEISRVIKPGGFVYVSIPFLMPFHASPSDYGRLTKEGLKHHFSEFIPLQTGMRGGPISALITFLMFFIPLPLSLVSKSLYQFSTYLVMFFLTPLRIFDLIFYLFPQSIELAAIIYFIGKKKEI